MTAPRSITRSAFAKVISDLGLDPHTTLWVRLGPAAVEAEVITDSDDPDATNGFVVEGVPRKLVRIAVVEDGATS